MPTRKTTLVHQRKKANPQGTHVFAVKRVDPADNARLWPGGGSQCVSLGCSTTQPWELDPRNYYIFYIDQKHRFVPLDRQDTRFPVYKNALFNKNKHSSQITNEEPNQGLGPTGGEEQVKGTQQE